MALFWSLPSEPQYSPTLIFFLHSLVPSDELQEGNGEKEAQYVCHHIYQHKKHVSLSCHVHSRPPGVVQETCPTQLSLKAARFFLQVPRSRVYILRIAVARGCGGGRNGDQ